jgi:hypothetical protein
MIGVDGKFMWFTGVVEDRADPKAMGRVRVRVLGIHTENKSSLPTEDLPWATVMLPTTAAGVGGLGDSMHSLVPGSWVIGFFRDGEDFQDPIVMGAIGGVPAAAPDTSKGFNDPSGTYPKAALVGLSDVSSLARNADLDADGPGIVAQKSEGRDLAVPTGDPDEPEWDEPEVPYAAAYTSNRVRQTESGHVQEFDDTPGAERIHEYHKSGTFYEIHPNGDKVVKVVGNGFTIVVGTDRIHVQGNVHMTVDGNMSTKVGGDWNVDVGLSWNVNVGMNISHTAGLTTTQMSGIAHERLAGAHIGDYAARIDHN